MTQPRIVGNRWDLLSPPVDDWAPRLTVSVVVPAYRADATLRYTLGALAAQTYPEELLEVVVVDDGEGQILSLPADAPATTRVVRPDSSWGRANACHVGALAATGDVIHWLDADMVPRRDEVERQMRWHHLLDHAVVLGHKTFVEPEDLPGPEETVAAIRAGAFGRLLDGVPQAEHEWVERFWRQTDDLVGAQFRAYQVHVGATASVIRDLYLAAGGMDTSLRLGEDVELGYRLQMCGAVFIADRSATSLHLGSSNLMRRKLEVERYNAPHVAQRVPDLRKFRRPRGRSYRVPFLEVVVDVTGQRFEDVAHTVDAVLRGRPADVRCVLVGPWSRVSADSRRDLLADPELDLRLCREEYAGDERVVLAETIDATAFPVPYRLHLPAGWAPGEQTAWRLLKEVREAGVGLWTLDFPDGRTGRLESTAAHARARRLAGPDELLDVVVAEVSAIRRSAAVDAGFALADVVEDAVAPAFPSPPATSTTSAAPAAAARRWPRRRRG